MLDKLGVVQQPTKISRDKSLPVTWSTKHFAEEYRRSEHVELRHHYVRELVETEQVYITKVSTMDIIVDFLTKPLDECSVRTGNVKVNVGVREN